MATCVRANFIVEETQQNMTKIFIYFGETQFNKFCVNNGIVMRNITKVSNQDYVLAAKNKKQTVITGKELLQ